MSGAKAVELDGVTLYAHFTGDSGGGVHVRVSVDEYDRLGLCEGQRVTVRLPGGPPAHLLLMSAARVPPFVWLDFASPSARRTG